MIYKYDLKTNKKAYVPYLIIGAMVLTALSTFLFLSSVLAVIITAIALWIASKMLKSMKNIVSSRVETYTEGFNVYLSDGTKLEFEYPLISHAGLITNTGFVFAYEESIDRIVQLPPVFTDFSDFIEELKENVPCYKDYTLEEGQTIIDWLKKELGITDESENEKATFDDLDSENEEVLEENSEVESSEESKNE
ncbi:MAG: hypothetical protein UIH41_10640 [Treponemataceae bacterium]|nr:hypothetical protein [Treponemataceae bacterium]